MSLCSVSAALTALALNGTFGLNCGMGAGAVDWRTFCEGLVGWLGVGVDVERLCWWFGSVRPSIGVNSSEADGVGEVICANVSDNGRA